MTWTRERWQRVEALFHDAVAQPPAAREAFVERAAGGDADLHAAVLRLVRADAADADPLLDRGLDDALPTADPLLQRRFGAFRAVAHLADGGMGSVYRAERAVGDFAQVAAIKVLRLGLLSPAARERFGREQQALARLAHPHITRLLDGGTTTDGVPFLVMELVDGAPIDRHCDQQRLPVAARLRLFARVCRAVHFAHQNLVLHLDLKPGNILVDRLGEPKLLDFGVASLLTHATGDGAAATATRSRPLTPEYASPELLHGASVSTAADVYGLGVVLFELLTGARPFGDARAALARAGAATTTDAARPSATLAAPDAGARAAARGATAGELARALRGDLDRIVGKALQPEPAQRYSSCQELADDIERHLAGFPVIARAPSLGYRCARFVQRNRVGVAAAAAVALSLVGGLVTTAHLWQVAGAERDEAAAARQQAEAEMQHARIESASSALVGAFLRETFLSTQFLDDEDLRATALATIERKAAQFRRQHASEPHLLANLLDALGQACLTFDAFAPADALLHEAAAMRRDTFGADSVEHALSLGSLGTSLFRQGRLVEARDALQRSHELHRLGPPGVHTDVARAANDLAAVERALGNRARARSLHEEALALRSRGQDPVPIAESLNNLANSEDDPARARELLTEALRLRAEVLGPDDPATLQAQANLGNLELGLGDFAGAAERLRAVVAHCRGLRALGLDQLAVSSRALAWAELQLGDAPAARAAIDEAIAIDRRRFGPGHPRVAGGLEVLASVLERQGEADAAVATWREALAIRTATLPEGHAQRTATQQGLGISLLRTAAAAEGLSHLEAALAQLQARTPPATSASIDVRLHLAHGRERGGDTAGAERELLAAWDLCGSDPAATPRRPLVARYLAAFYGRHGRAADAARFEATARGG